MNLIFFIQNKQRQAAREQGSGEYDESHGKHSQPEQIVKFPLSVLNGMWHQFYAQSCNPAKFLQCKY